MKKLISCCTVFLIIIFFTFDLNGKTGNKKFELYDAMNYVGKPDLSKEGLLPILLIYEAHLTTQDPNDQYGIVLDMDKIQTHVDIAKYTNQKIICTDIEHWYGDRNINSVELEKRFTKLFNTFKNQLTDIEISNYGVAPSALCVTRFYDNGKTEAPLLLERWKKNNQKRWDVAKTVDYFAPSVYIAEPNIESWINDLKITVDEIRKFDPEKKLIVYIWPNYYDKPGSPYFKEFVSPDIWEKMLEAVYEYCDGAIIWSSSLDKNKQRVSWNDPNVQAFMEVTRRFVKKYSDHLVQPPKEPKLPSSNTFAGKDFTLLGAVRGPGSSGMSSYGINPIRIISDVELSLEKDGSGICLPDSIKITAFANSINKKEVELSTLILSSNWMSDRIKDNGKMLDRFEMVQRIYKKHNNVNKLCFHYDITTTLNSQRKNNTSFLRNVTNWMHSFVVPTRLLSQYTDVMMCAGTIINEDVNAWERDFRITVAEARKLSPQKLLYAYMQPVYTEKGGGEIASETWFRMLEIVYELCDGAVIDSDSWGDSVNFCRATDAFLKKYKIQAID